MHETAVVFLAHTWGEAIARRFGRLRSECSSFADCYLLLQDDDPHVVAQWNAALESIGAQGAMFRFNALTLPTELGLRYFGMRGVLSNTHFPLMLFARTHPHAYYWQVEYDVEYRGTWREFFEARAQTDAALVACHFHNWAEWPDWFWWPSFTKPTGVTLQTEHLYKAFMPIARFSHRALQDIEQAHRDGWMGHFEAVVPTVLLRCGHRLEDLNARGACYVPGYQDPIPLLTLLSSIRHRPPVGEHEFRSRGQGALLFHPVKDSWTFDGKELHVVKP